MKKLTCLSAAFCILAFAVSAQSNNWFTMMKDQKANVHDVQKAFYAWWNQQPNSNNTKARQGEDRENTSYMLFKRWESMMDIRTFPSGNRPDRSAIAADYQRYLASEATQRIARTQTAANWSYAGNTSVPGNGGGDGRVNHLRFMPGNTNTIFACAATGGLWVSTNGGGSWSVKTDRLLDLATMDVAIDPSNTNVMYLATGDGDGIYGGYTTLSTAGILKTTDGGNTWNPTGLYINQANSGPAFATANALAINPNTTNILLAATSFGLYYSSDAGSSFTQIMQGNFKDVEMEPGHPNTVYCTEDNGMFFRSTNGGITWTRTTNGLPVAYSGNSPYSEERMEIGVTPADSNYVYVLVTDTIASGFLGLYLSTDRGQTFTMQSNSPNVIGGQGWYTLSIGVSPTNANHVIVGGLDNYLSTDGGVTWNQVSVWNSWPSTGYVHADVHVLTYVPGSGTNILVGCDGGVFKTTNEGTSWTDISNNLEIAELYSAGPSALTSGLEITGWQDNGTSLSKPSWAQTMGGDGMVCFIDYTNDQNMFAEYYSGQLQMSTNGGATWGWTGFGISENGPWVTKWKQDPNNANNIFCGCNNLWINTTNGNGTWNAVSTWGTISATITDFAIYPSNDNYIYAAIPGALYYTTNGGANWNNVTGTLPVGSAGIAAVAISRLNPSHVWVGMSGYSAGNKMFYSANAGVTWTNISASLPNLPVNCLIYQKNSPDGIYAGTDRGVYYHDTIIGTWVNYSNNLPNVIVNELEFSSTGMLLAATFGRGVWQTATYTSPTQKPTVYISAFPRKFCVADTVQFMDSSLYQPYAWSWRFPGGNPSTSTQQNPLVIYSTAGTYPVTLIARNAHGVDSSTVASYITVYALTVPVITQASYTLTCSPSGMVYYQWYYPNGSPIPGATTNTYVFSLQGRYTCAITNANGCTDTASFQTSNVTGVSDLAQNGYMRIYPNPTNDNVNVVLNMPKEQDYTLTLTDVLGQTVYSDKMHAGTTQTSVSLSMSGYGKGVYFLSLIGSDVREVKKIVVMNK